MLCLTLDCGHGFRRVKRGNKFICVKIIPHKCKPGYRMVKKGRRLVCQKPVPDGHKCHKGEHLIRQGRKHLCVKTNIRCKRFFRAVMIGKKQMCKPVKRCPKGYFKSGKGKSATCKRFPHKPHPHKPSTRKFNIDISPFAVQGMKSSVSPNLSMPCIQLLFSDKCRPGYRTQRIGKTTFCIRSIKRMSKQSFFYLLMNID